MNNYEMEDKNSAHNICARAKLIEAMNTIVLALNNEDALDLWLALGVADGDNDYISYADADAIEGVDGDTSIYEDCARAFVACIKRYGKDGFYCGNVLSYTK